MHIQHGIRAGGSDFVTFLCDSLSLLVASVADNTTFQFFRFTPFHCYDQSDDSFSLYLSLLR